MSRWPLCALVMIGCGVQTVELAPRQGELLLLDGLPASTATRFDTAREEGREEPKLQLGYPAGDSALPRDFAPLTFRWEPEKKAGGPMMMGPPGDAVLYELRIEGAREPLRIFTVQSEVRVPDDRWRKLLEQNEGQTLRVQLRALDTMDKLRAGKAVALEVHPALAGSLFYWSDDMQRVMRISATTEPNVVASSVCAACWALSPDGRSLLETSAPNTAQLRSLRDTTTQPLYPASTLRDLDGCNWSSTAEPVCSGSEGSTAYLAAETPAALLPALHMALAPDGQRAVYVTPPGMGMGAMGMGAMGMGTMGMGRLEQATFSQGALVEPQLLASVDKGDELLSAPCYADDGALIAFQRSKGKDGKDSALWLVPAAGGEPLALEGAKQDMTPALVRAPGTEGLYWLLFASAREPGHKLAPEQSQLWLWGVLYQPGGALTPVKAPLWLPFQRAEQDNLRPRWVAD